MNKRKLIFTSAIANIFEWYDYALFAQFATILGNKFFPASDPATSVLQAFMAFAIGYLIRPIGGIFFGIIGDKFGRRTALSASIICMAFPTALIGVLPVYDSIGLVSTALLILVRILQGLSMGGALTGSISFIIEHTETKSRGLIASIPMSSICIGFLLASFVSYLVKSSMFSEQFNDWGWRLPFLIGIFILFAGIYIRKHTSETPLFKKMQDSNKIIDSPLRNVITNHWRDMLISIFINATGSVLFYLQAVYLVTFLKLHRNFDEAVISNLANFCYIIMALVTLFSGWLSDRIGRARIFAVNLILIIVFSPILLQFIESGDLFAVMIAQVGLAILAAVYIGPEPALQAEFYPTNVRNTALSVSYNLATSIFGGPTPLIAAYLLQQSGGLAAIGWYLVTYAVFSLVALYFYAKRLQGNLVR